MATKDSLLQPHAPESDARLMDVFIASEFVLHLRLVV